MDATVKVTIKETDGLIYAHKALFETDIQETLEHLLLKQGVGYKNINFEFSYADSKKEEKHA